MEERPPWPSKVWETIGYPWPSGDTKDIQLIERELLEIKLRGRYAVEHQENSSASEIFTSTSRFWDRRSSSRGNSSHRVSIHLDRESFQNKSLIPAGSSEFRIQRSRNNSVTPSLSKPHFLKTVKESEVQPQRLGSATVSPSLSKAQREHSPKTVNESAEKVTVKSSPIQSFPRPVREAGKDLPFTDSDSDEDSVHDSEDCVALHTLIFSAVSQRQKLESGAVSEKERTVGLQKKQVESGVAPDKKRTVGLQKKQVESGVAPDKKRTVGLQKKQVESGVAPDKKRTVGLQRPQKGLRVRPPPSVASDSDRDEEGGVQKRLAKGLSALYNAVSQRETSSARGPPSPLFTAAAARDRIPSISPQRERLDFSPRGRTTGQSSQAEKTDTAPRETGSDHSCSESSSCPTLPLLDCVAAVRNTPVETVQTPKRRTSKQVGIKPSPSLEKGESCGSNSVSLGFLSSSTPQSHLSHFSGNTQSHLSDSSGSPQSHLSNSSGISVSHLPAGGNTVQASSIMPTRSPSPGPSGRKIPTNAAAMKEKLKKEKEEKDRHERERKAREQKEKEEKLKEKRQKEKKEREKRQQKEKEKREREDKAGTSREMDFTDSSSSSESQRGFFGRILHTVLHLIFICLLLTAIGSLGFGVSSLFTTSAQEVLGLVQRGVETSSYQEVILALVGLVFFFLILGLTLFCAVMLVPALWVSLIEVVICPWSVLSDYFLP